MPRLFLIFVLVGLGYRLRDPVEIPLSSLSDAPTTLLLVLLQNAYLLEGLDNLAVDTAAGVDMYGGPGTAVLCATCTLSVLCQLGRREAANAPWTFRRRPTPTVFLR